MNITNRIYLGIFGIVLFLIIILGIKCYTLNKDLNNAIHNLNASKDSITTLTLKNGQQLATINSYILDKKQMQEYMNLTKSEMKDLEKKVGKIGYISNIKTEIQYDTITSYDTVIIKDDITKFNIKHTDEWLKLHGTSYIKDNVATTVLDTISINTPLQVGLTDDYRVWVVSPNPYLKISDIKSTIIKNSQLNKKQKKFGVGIQVGYGTGYDMVNKRLLQGPYIGIGVSYNFLFF